MYDQALIVFIKWPELGKVKTRLQPELSLQASVQLYKAMTEDIVRRFTNISGFDMILFFDPPSALNKIKAWLGTNQAMIPQSGNTLGDRMHNAFTYTFKKGYKKILLIGSDIPSLELEDVFHGFDGLEHHEIVLGPSPDGGYYLIGMNQINPNVFENIIWSSDTVLGETVKRIQDDKLRYKLLSVINDIDTFDDLLELWNYYQQNLLTCDALKQNNTYQVLSEIIFKQ